MELMERGFGYISKVESTSICYQLDAKGERKGEVKDVSKAFGLSSWKMDGDQCDRRRRGVCCQKLNLGLASLRYQLDSQVESQVSS